MLVITDRKSSLEIDLVSWDGDAYISVNIDSRGYSGQNDLHIDAEEFKKFCADIFQLQKTLKGKAVLNSISPDELHIEIKPDGGSGHMSVRGKCGYHIHTDRQMNWHSIEFGFEFEPQQLDKAIKVDWIVTHAT